MFQKDQAIRGKDFFEGDTEAKADADKDRRERVHRLLDEGLVRTGEDFWHAAMIFQHGDKPEDYLMAHVLASVAMQKGNPNAPWLSAATLDRYLMSIKRSQIFGTQYLFRGDGGYTQEPMDSTLISDALREVFEVPDAEARKERLLELQKAQTP